MIGVEARPVAPPSPAAPRPALPWLAIFACSFLLSVLVPWERWCGNGTPESPGHCFSAHIWSGSAPLLGVVAVVIVLLLVGTTLRAGIRSAPEAGRLVMFGGLLAAITAKAAILFFDAAKTTSENAGSPAWLGAWIGLATAGLGWMLLISMLAWRTPRSRAVAAVLAVAALVGSLSVPYARSGLAWWGGPLAQPEGLGGGNGVGMQLEVGKPRLLDSVVWVHNGAPIDVTLDGLDLVNSSIQVLGTYVLERGPCRPGMVVVSDLADFHPDECAYPLPGFRLQPGGKEESVLLTAVVEVPSTGVYRSDWLRVRYHAGVLPFQMFKTDQLTLCAPMPGAEQCPDD